MIYDHTPTLTSDATPVVAWTIELDDYYAGVLRVEIVAKKDLGTTTGKFSRVWYVGFEKDTTLALDTEDVVHDQNAIAGASVQVVNDSENLGIEITGVAATDIQWTCRTEILMINATNFP